MHQYVKILTLNTLLPVINVPPSLSLSLALSQALDEVVLYSTQVSASGPGEGHAGAREVRVGA